MDPLSDVLSLVRPTEYVAGGLLCGGRWGLAFPAHAAIKCYAVLQGGCLAVIDGVKQPVALAAGDCLMLPHGRSFRLCSDVRARAVDARTIVTVPGRDNGFRVVGTGNDFSIVGGSFALGGNASFLLRMLPPAVHLRSAEPSLRSHIERLADELRTPRPGGVLLAQQSAYAMLVLVLRMHLGRGDANATGWLFALGRPQLARALAGIHDRPGHAWTVQTLADQAGMSRTTFAEHFRRTVGESPIEYLTRWRMLVAGDRLRRSDTPVAVIASDLGYDSESAFGAAFKRTLGTSPRAYARSHAAAAGPPPSTGSGRADHHGA